jgi:prepilin-type processing-associated H-X9-DG protein
MSNELSTPKILFCPEDKRRIQATTFAKTVPTSGINEGVCFSNSSNASYFVHLDSDSSTPQMLLLGDDNLLIGGKATIDGVAIKGIPVKSGVLSLWTNTPVAWSDERHKKKGNIGLADGSVQEFTSSRLAEALHNTGVATNRLAFP